MRTSTVRPVVFLAAYVAVLHVPGAAVLFGQLIVPNRHLGPEEVSATMPLVGFRKVPEELFASGSHHDRNGIPVNWFLASTKATPSLKAAIMRGGSNPHNASLGAWYTASRKDSFCRSTATGKPDLIEVPIEDARVAVADSMAISCLAGTELFGSPTVKVYETSQPRGVQWMEANPLAFQTFSTGYAFLHQGKVTQVPDAHNRFNAANQTIAGLPLLSKTVTFRQGQVTFGRPKLLIPDEVNIGIPPSLKTERDFYVAQFAVTYSDTAMTDVESASFEVTSDGQASAAELLPLRFDAKTVEASTRRGADPRGTVLGQLYGADIVFESLSPTIVAYGLQETRFWWTMSDDACKPGANRFVALLEVPRGLESIALTLQASVRKEGGLWVEGGLLATEIHKLDVDLPKARE